ncbi:TAXI family TRAP transporter solute-binding subunit [Stutzerimonas azotifigens]|uniref:TAXI family TRAP transporter solute-binding subunit n=1 Tax=Stutzerimonas azotifigens TaxID=291995 RepID=UPI000419C71C|nr:TAXI family TRAP transporter solute-binding subunit [Stutzerimonas azotifigens]
MHIKQLLSASCLSLAVLAAQASAKEVIVSAVSPTSDDYALAVAWSNISAREKGESLTVVDNGTIKGLRLLATDKVNVAVIGSPHFKDATLRQGQFSEDPDRLVERYKHMKALFAIRSSAGQYLVTEKSGIKAFADFKGRSLAVGRPGGQAGSVTAGLLKATGLEPGKDVDTQYITYSEAFDQMANGSLDGTMVWGSVPQAAVDNASRTMKLRFVSPDPAVFEDFKRDVTSGEYFSLKTVPASRIQSAYEGRVESDGDVRFWTFPFMFVVNDTMDEETAYRITRSLWEHVEEIRSTTSALALLDIDDATQMLSADLHPGAARYFREKGLIQ